MLWVCGGYARTWHVLQKMLVHTQACCRFRWADYNCMSPWRCCKWPIIVEVYIRQRLANRRAFTAHAAKER